MPDSFERAVGLEPVEEGVHRLVVPDGWQQGRGAFGGLVLAALMEAIGRTEPDASRLVRALTGDLSGPVLPKESLLRAHVVRRGTNQTNVTATLEQDGAVLATAAAVLASPRRTAPIRLGLGLDRPDQPPYEATPVAPLGPPFGPTFTQHYEYRPTGPPPFSGGAEAVVLGWVKEKVPLSRMTPAAMLGRLDAYWPALFSIESAPRPMATVSFTAELLRDPSTLDPTAPLFYRGRAIVEAGGYVVEMRELWHGEAPVALNQQTFAVLG